MKVVAPFLIAMVLLIGAGIPAEGSPIIGSATGLSSPVQTITFDEHILSMNSVVTNQYSDLGVTFSPNLYYSPQTGYPNINGNDLGNFTFNGDGPVTSFTLTFNQPITGAAFAFVGDVTPYTFTSLLNGVPVESFTATVGFTTSEDFFGFENSAFDQITVTQAGQGGGPFNLLDNLQMGAPVVPEPSSLTLLGVAAVSMFGYCSWRRQQKTATA
jgi:hypothetical protein